MYCSKISRCNKKAHLEPIRFARWALANTCPFRTSPAGYLPIRLCLLLSLISHRINSAERTGCHGEQKSPSRTLCFAVGSGRSCLHDKPCGIPTNRSTTASIPVYPAWMFRIIPSRPLDSIIRVARKSSLLKCRWPPGLRALLYFLGAVSFVSVRPSHYRAASLRPQSFFSGHFRNLPTSGPLSFVTVSTSKSSLRPALNSNFQEAAGLGPGEVADRPTGGPPWKRRCVEVGPAPLGPELLA